MSHIYKKYYNKYNYSPLITIKTLTGGINE